MPIIVKEGNNAASTNATCKSRIASCQVLISKQSLDRFKRKAKLIAWITHFYDSNPCVFL